MAEVSTATAVETGRHLHRCQNCGVIWGHGNMMAEDVEAHKCPKCGKQEWRVYSGGASHPAKTAAGQTQLILGWRPILQIALLAALIVLIAELAGEFIVSLGQKNGGS